MFYYHQILVARLSQERARSARQHFNDWHYFVNHVRDEKRVAGAIRFQFPSVVSQRFWKFAANIKHSGIVQREGSRAVYSLTADFENMSEKDAKFCPKNVKVVDKNWEIYDSYAIFPSSACTAISTKTSVAYRFLFRVLPDAVPSQLILIGPSGISQFSLEADPNPLYDPSLEPHESD